MKIIGSCSFFGGPTDSGMDRSEGLSYYESLEADLRPDLFLPRSSDPTEGVSQRLRNNQAYYIATRVTGDRSKLRDSLWKVINPRTGQWVVAALVDYGPAISTGRVVDLSDAIGRALRLETNDEVEIELIHM